MFAPFATVLVVIQIQWQELSARRKPAVTADKLDCKCTMNTQVPDDYSCPKYWSPNLPHRTIKFEHNTLIETQKTKMQHAIERACEQGARRKLIVTLPFDPCPNTRIEEIRDGKPWLWLQLERYMVAGGGSEMLWNDSHSPAHQPIFMDFGLSCHEKRIFRICKKFRRYVDTRLLLPMRV